jgi:hypothetical protein
MASWIKMASENLSQDDEDSTIPCEDQLLENVTNCDSIFDKMRRLLGPKWEEYVVKHDNREFKRRGELSKIKKCKVSSDEYKAWFHETRLLWCWGLIDDEKQLEFLERHSLEFKKEPNFRDSVVIMREYGLSEVGVKNMLKVAQDLKLSGNTSHINEFLQALFYLFDVQIKKVQENGISVDENVVLPSKSQLMELEIPGREDFFDKIIDILL